MGDSAFNNTPDSENEDGGEYEDANNSVKWGVVEEILFSRTVSCSSVPTDGAYPLGLGAEESRSISLIDDLHPPVKRAEQEDAASDSEAIGSSQNGKEKRASAKKPTQRSRSNSIIGSGHPFKINSEQLRVKELQANTQNWSIINDSSKNDLAFSVIELNKDINTINESRKHSGCSCKPVKIDSGTSRVKLIGGIKAATATIGLEKEVDEAELLIKESELQDMSKADLLLKAKDLVSQCQLCVSSGCECVANEVPCSMDTCGCLQHGYHPELHAQSCNNPFDRVLYNKRMVRTYRRDILESMDMCQNIRRNSIDSIDDDAHQSASSPPGSPQRRGRSDSINSVNSTASTGSLLSSDSLDIKGDAVGATVVALNTDATNDMSDVSSAPAPAPAGAAETTEITSGKKKKKRNKNTKKGGGIAAADGSTATAAAASATEATNPPSNTTRTDAQGQSLNLKASPFPAFVSGEAQIEIETKSEVVKANTTSPSKRKKSASSSLSSEEQEEDLGVARIPKGKEWSCPICTLVNSATSGCCDACGEIKR